MSANNRGGWTNQGGGLIAPVQAKAVVITTTESYSIMETVEQIAERLNGMNGNRVAQGDHVFIKVTPKEGGTALLNVAHIVGFASEDNAAETA